MSVEIADVKSMRSARDWVDSLGNRVARQSMAASPAELRQFVEHIQEDAVNSMADIVRPLSQSRDALLAACFDLQRPAESNPPQLDKRTLCQI